MHGELEVYFIDEQGQRWRVHDVAFGPPLAEPGKRKVLEHGDPRARYRMFVPANPDAMLRMHDFQKTGGDRDLSVMTLAAQLRAATWTPRRSEREPPAEPGAKLGQ